MGTIQPARYLSHSGRILPGVRRIVNVANPATATDWSVAVPGGNMWRILGGQATLTTSAVVANRFPVAKVTVQGVVVELAPATASQAASLVVQHFITSNYGLMTQSGQESGGVLSYIDEYFPDGTLIGSNTAGTQAGDQWSAISLWIEEVYATDALLAEIERKREQEIRELIREEIRQAQAGGGQ